jgi:(R,R)-butanediol dehydrogenase / meso-butanediol dehydrogenase / diacetyl reductase
MTMSGLPTKMRAAVYERPGRLRIEDRTVPSPADGEVLIEVSHCGICGSDLHMVLEGWGTPETVGGHEFSGRIAAVGPGADAWVVGDLVVADPRRVCGACPACRDDRPSLCRAAPVVVDSWEGGFADYVMAHTSQLHRIPEGLSLRHAALTEPLAVALHGITRSGTGAGDRVLVTGTGPIGLLAIAALRARGAGEIIASEPHAARRARAAEVGAHAVIRPEELVAPDLPTETVAEPFDVVLECAGSARAIESGLAQLRPGGTLVIVGAGLEPPRIDPNRVLLHELVVTGSFNYDAQGFADALELLAGGEMPLDALVEPEDVGLDDLLDAMQTLASGATTRKVLVIPR